MVTRKPEEKEEVQAKMSTESNSINSLYRMSKNKGMSRKNYELLKQ